MKVIHAQWEIENIGRDTYEVVLESTDTPEALKQAAEECVRAGAEYLVVKTPVNCPKLLFSLGAMGYTFVEASYQVMMTRKDYHMPEIIARFDRGLTVDRITDGENQNRVLNEIRRGIFVSDRVSIDPEFGVEKGGNRYANWLGSMIRGGADLYEVSMKNQKPIGFFVIQRVDEQTVNPVLMGMYDEQNDRGLGTLLHKKTMDTCFSYPCDRLVSTIVSNNAKVFSVYINAGASITQTQYIYVKHIC